MTLGQNVDIWVPTGVNGVDITYVINGVPLDPPHIARSNSYHKHCRFCQSHIHSKITISGFIPSIKNYFTIYRRINLGNWVNIATTSSTTYIDSWLEVNPRGSQRIDYQVTMTTFTPEESAPSNTVTTWFDYINKQLVEGDLPDEYELKTNHPNPFNPVTTIAFGLPVPSYVELKIYDFLGREVKILVNRNIDAGFKDVQWDGKDQDGRTVASGMYIYTINARSIKSDKQFTQSGKMVLLR